MINNINCQNKDVSKTDLADCLQDMTKLIQSSTNNTRNTSVDLGELCMMSILNTPTSDSENCVRVL